MAAAAATNIVKNGDSKENEEDYLDLARELVEDLRRESNLPYLQCQYHVGQIVTSVQQRLGGLGDRLQPLCDTLENDILDISRCEDRERLEKVIGDIRGMKADSQQRSWSLYADERQILDEFKEMADLLKLSDPRVALHVLAEDSHGGLNDIVLFHQMETRTPVRLSIVNVLTLACELSPAIVSVLLTTILPLELARQLLEDTTEDTKTRPIIPELRLLTLLFSTAEKLPYTHYDVLNENFVARILALGESENDDVTSLHAHKLLVAFNLHFDAYSDSRVMTALKEDRHPTKRFSENVIQLLNESEKGDKIWPYDPAEHPPAPYVSSIVKFLQDIFSLTSEPENSQLSDRLFYRNDADVLSDVLLRFVTDMGPSKMRTECLSLIQLISAATDYMAVRRDDLLVNLDGIERSMESASDSAAAAAATTTNDDQLIIRTIRETLMNRV